jgi:hypothetical protein
VPLRFQRVKYSAQNIERYVHYIAAMRDLPFERVKFLDEVHFVSKGAPWKSCTQ